MPPQRASALANFGKQLTLGLAPPDFAPSPVWRRAASPSKKQFATRSVRQD
eukprot:CAMPEP_0198543096 /NCGR_PEP_ID=MMETSP1462-20131121/59487_1 /TAXON_ID=1333877 /ORGANISM="Brandtodinium nutriculum, Strain RCC3387" /LENGTH=50 /DNA_ID=CAMNT_0044273361 /DNA_START=108 /DNA_END=257 /DNA_ORIENTATION=-